MEYKRPKQPMKAKNPLKYTEEETTGPLFHPRDKMHCRQNGNNQQKTMEQVQDIGFRRTTDGRRYYHFVELTSDESTRSQSHQTHTFG
jgi:predicted ATPase